MSGEGILRRSSWKAEAIRRGDLKISGPIPITEETPLSDEEEREYAQKHSMDPPPPLSEPALEPPEPAHPPPSIPEESLHTVPETVEPAHPEAQEQEEPRQQQQTNGVRQMGEPPRKSSPEPTVTSPSPFPSIPESTTKTTPKKKRKSGLRNVFRKMFGRRSRERPQEEEEEDTVHRHGYHRSDPGMLRQSQQSTVPERANTTAGRPRISDLPVRELQPINPLGQHLPFPMNVNAPQEASPPHEYLTFEVPDQLGRRRATLPSVLLTHNEASAISAAWGGKSSMSFDERQEIESPTIPSPQIGMAISSPTGAQSIASKRRSRSAGALRDWAKASAAGRPSAERRRSEEIRYWRHSGLSGSLYSSNTPRPRTAQTVETVRSIDERPVGARKEVEISESRDIPEASVAQHDQDLSQIQLPVEAFNFGNLKSEFSDDEHHSTPAHEVEPIAQESEVPTKSPKRTTSKRLSIEDRVQYLEDNVRALEGSVRRFSGRSNRQTIILENAPKGRRSSRNRSSSATSDRQSSHHSSKSSNQTLSIRQSEPSDPPSPTLAPLSAVSEFPSSSQNRPQTIIALEPSALSKSQSQPQDVEENFTQVYAQLKHERASRKALEKQVISLQRELVDLHNLFTKFISAAASPSYPTPSPDAIIASNEERLSTPRAIRRPEHPKIGLGFESDSETSVPPSNRVPGTSARKPRVLSRFSQSDSEGGGEGGGEWSTSSSKEDVTSPEAWATPKEESGFGIEFAALKTPRCSDFTRTTFSSESLQFSTIFDANLNECSFGTKAIAIRVGKEPDHQDFTVHEKLLKSSKYLQAALEDRSKESEDRVIHLPEQYPILEHDGCDLLWGYLLGEDLQDINFKDTLSDAMLEWTAEATIDERGFAITMNEEVYCNLPRNTPVRRILVDITVWEIGKSVFRHFLDLEDSEDHVQFLKDVLWGLESRRHAIGELSPLVEHKGTCYYHCHGKEPCYKVKLNGGTDT
ncbi:hypothetical protein BDV96DRAFT_639192 [Lophiotrema nucula]|uniref:BTB domain-containing protein n=1 Tax=Lophiotrema nucula TaxID=690887 RepID=A0A6A5ZU60_9PLEO|nr:hypothetical protein BDV96DRAFT_639192 [Lophiotrema nucula]